MSAKIRIDQLLVERGLASSRNRAQAMILAGEVLNGDLRIDKAGTRVDEDAALRIRPRSPRYVSRAGAKIVAALDAFQLRVEGRVCLDSGASTGGFVGVLLERGAQRVYAVDVGYGQLDYKLQTDPRVLVRDRVNLRYLDVDKLGEKVDFVSLDLSFISLTKVLEAVRLLLNDQGQVLCLVKPQFEVGRNKVGKGGIVRDEEARQGAVEKVREYAESIGFKAIAHIDSPLPGSKGNREFLLLLEKVEGS